MSFGHERRVYCVENVHCNVFINKLYWYEYFETIAAKQKVTSETFICFSEDVGD